MKAQNQACSLGLRKRDIYVAYKLKYELFSKGAFWATHFVSIALNQRLFNCSSCFAFVENCGVFVVFDINIFAILIWCSICSEMVSQFTCVECVIEYKIQFHDHRMYSDSFATPRPEKAQFFLLHKSFPSIIFLIYVLNI